MGYAKTTMLKNHQCGHGYKQSAQQIDFTAGMLPLNQSKPSEGVKPNQYCNNSSNRVSPT
jgi:hypothetical protein